MAVTPTGLVVPVGSEAFDPATDITDLATSLTGRIMVPVANVSARNALYAAVGASASKPLVVFRADAPPGQQVEYTTDNTTWRPVNAGNGNPYAMAMGTGVRVFAAATSGAFTINLPAGRFSVPPVVMIGNGNPSYGVFFGASATTTLITAQGYGGAAGLSVAYNWVALQATSTSAGG